MKKLTVLAATLSFLSLPAFAQQQQQQQPECDHTTGMHCAYFKGDSAKWVSAKATLTNKADGSVKEFGPYTFCLNHYGLYVDNDFIYNGVANVDDTFKLEFSQCSDFSCETTIPLANDEFVINKAQDGYTSTPPTATIQLNDQFGEACGPARSGARSLSMKQK